MTVEQRTMRDPAKARPRGGARRGGRDVTVGDIMTRGAGYCRPSAALDAVARVMRDRNCGMVPVVDSDGTLVGVITDRDICLAALAQDQPLRDIPVRQHMTREVHFIDEDASIVEAERRMLAGGVRRLPVTRRDGRLIGVLSLTDIACASGGDEPNERGLSPEAFAQTFCAIAAAHRRGPRR